MKGSSIAAGIVLLGGSLITPSIAIPIAGIETNSESGLGDFTGTFVYTPLTATTATINLTLTNTSPAANGGFLTAFAFNNPGDQITGVTLSIAPASMDSLLGGPTFNNTINAQPYGDFDIGVGVGDNGANPWQGGGNPNDGIPVGSTFNFQFSLTGTDLNTLTEASFQAERSDDYNGSHGDFAPLVDGIQGPWNVARFRGFEDGGSDKVPGAGPGETVTTVPEPQSLLLMAVGLGILSFYIRRRFTLK